MHSPPHCPRCHVWANINIETTHLAVQKATLTFSVLIERSRNTYSAFANSCPLQIDTFVFPLIHSHHIVLSFNKF